MTKNVVKSTNKNKQNYFFLTYFFQCTQFFFTRFFTDFSVNFSKKIIILNYVEIFFIKI